MIGVQKTMRSQKVKRYLRNSRASSLGAAFVLAREAGESIKPGVERSGTPGFQKYFNPEPVKRATAASVCEFKLFRYLTAINKLLPPTTWARLSFPLSSWGSAALHPRLYSCTRFAGWRKPSSSKIRYSPTRINALNAQHCSSVPADYFQSREMKPSRDRTYPYSLQVSGLQQTRHLVQLAWCKPAEYHRR